MDIYRKYITYAVDDFIDLHNLSFLETLVLSIISTPGVVKILILAL